ncbi:MAG: PEP/pyruvate-binding domain-containing protein [Armatimonadota bacterium]|nr:hypothetical protein [bacterium]
MDVSLILPLVEAQRNRRAGSKAINLSKLIAAHFAVPRGFVISADAYRSHLWACGARDIASSAADAEDREKIRSAVMAADIPEDILKAVRDAYQRLSLQLGFENPVVVVRSSAMECPTGETGFPGAYETILNVSGLDALNTAIKRVWASLWSGKAAAYRMRYGITAEPAMAVIVQQMMDAQWSGTVLTADPVTGDRNRVMVSCSLTSSPSDVSCCVVDLHDPSEPACGDDLDKSPGKAAVALLAEKAVVVEQTLGSSVEVDWVYDRDRLWVLQARPMINVPPYFPADEDFQACLPVMLRRLTYEPVSFFARGSLCESSLMRVVHGCVYGRTEILTDLPKSASEGLRLLEEWETRAGRALRTRASDIVAFDRANAELGVLIGRAVEAVENVKLASEWIARAAGFGAMYVGELDRMIPCAQDDMSVCRRLLGGLPGGLIMRDARLQELAEQFCVAEKSGKIDDTGWRRSYKADVESFAWEYGYCVKNPGEALDVASWESWIENTDIVFRMIAAINRRSSKPSLITLHCAAENDYRQAVSEVGLSIGGGRRSRFEKTLRSARGWLALGNDCELTLGLACAGLRLIMIELGHRLSKAKIITDPGDVFHLCLAEIADAGDETAALVAQRKHELWLEQRLSPPAFLPVGSDDHSALMHGEDDTALSGIGICSGTVSGRVRVARSIEDAGEIEPGEILVVGSATLAWTPFLAVAGGFICEGERMQPGVESIIRTYGVPAVIGCKGVTGILHDGLAVTLDGLAGKVETGKKVTT